MSTDGTTTESLPSNFKSVAELTEAFKNAQAELTRKSQELAEIRKKTETATNQTNTTEDVGLFGQKIDKPQASYSLEALKEEFLSNAGNFTPATIAKLKAQNLNDEAINALHLAVKSNVSAQIEAASNIVGGREKLQAVIDYAIATHSPEELAAINRSMATPAWQVVFNGLVAKMNADPNAAKQTAVTPKGAVGTGKVHTGAVKAFSSKAELTAALRDPKYASDIDYRNEVEARLRETHTNGFRTK